jgi:hypothetical protein
MQYLVCIQNQKPKICMAATRKKIIYRNSEHEVHQVGPKNTENQNLSFLAFKGEAVGVTQICVQQRVTDGKFFFAHIMFLSIRKS